MSTEMRTIPGRVYLKAFHTVNDYATAEQIRILLFGSAEPNHRTEVMTHRLVAKGKLRETKYGARKVYIVPRFKKPHRVENIEHGLGSTEGMVRLLRSDMSAEVIPSNYFRGMGSIPEWGMKFKDNLLLYEFCTRSNYYSQLRKKIEAYERNLYKIEEEFGKAFVLFVCDVDREYVRKFEPKPDWAMFTDFLTFKSIPIGNQLTAPIYFWCDGQELPLRHGLETD
jgi:hypothetical protein